MSETAPYLRFSGNRTGFPLIFRTGIPFCLLSGLIAGKKISFRTLSIIGMLGYIIFGALPFLMSNFTAILICRLLLGACMGLMLPLGNSLMILTLPAKLVSTMVGLNLVIQNIGIAFGFIFSLTVKNP